MNALSATGLSLEVDRRWLLREVDFELKPGEMLGLIGPNGAGKTTLLRLLTGLISPTSGQIRLSGAPLASTPARVRARTIAYLPQNTVAHWPVTVERILELGRIPHLESWTRPGPADERVIESVMRRTDIVPLRDRPINTLSGGERARVLLARALVTEPAVLLADEPVAALDPSHQMDVMALIREHCASGRSAVVVLHDLRLAAHYCDRFQLLLDGRNLAVGGVGEVFTRDNLERAYEITIDDDFESVSDAIRLTWRSTGASNGSARPL